MVTLHAVQAHNAALTSLASGLVAVFGKFTCSNIPHSTMNNYCKYPSFGSLQLANTLQSAVPLVSPSQRPSPSPVTPHRPRSTSSAAASPLPMLPSPPSKASTPPRSQPFSKPTYPFSKMSTACAPSSQQEKNQLTCFS
jgi:hypothetical protein